MQPIDPLTQAEDPNGTPFDYIVVGSGAGGDPAIAEPHTSRQPMTQGAADIAQQQMRQVYAVPAFHAAATEDEDMSWKFSVRHYSDTSRQMADSKYNADKDPATKNKPYKGGIFYPRAAALGGCTAHHAMIIIRPNDADWDRIARYTGDDSWRSENMQGYFGKIENCLYYTAYRSFGAKTLGWIFRAIEWCAGLIAPRSQFDPGGHGSNGWQKTSFIDPLVIATIARGDKIFLGVLRHVLGAVLTNGAAFRMLAHAAARFQLLQFLDPNVRSPDIASRAHVSLISIGTDGKRRCGLRDHLLSVQSAFPDRLVIPKPAHVTRILFDQAKDDVPRAIGVELREGSHLYEASPMFTHAADKPATRQVFAKREVIICGGAFNTPQLLMLSGIGDEAHLRDIGIAGLSGKDGVNIAPVINLPGVGKNLQDRYEVSVISQTRRDFSTLHNVGFEPGNTNDPKLTEWVDKQSGLYTTNGGAIAMMMSSTENAKLRCDPDLFIFGIPAAFRGYYWNYSRQLLWRSMTANQQTRNLWSWVILKAYTNNTYGTVRLRCSDPFRMPEINFASFDDTPQGKLNCNEDIDALCDAIQRIRQINSHVSEFSSEIQPGGDRCNYSDSLRNWIRNEAWGHHACGTCRIGYDPWRADPRELQDSTAVVDSSFRVHGLKGLRIVDTSVFPFIPGYFIVTPTFMISEKAADVLLADSESYPAALESDEAKAVHTRRRAARPGQANPHATDTSMLPDNAVGLAFSGGGVRSATYCLGVLQALAKRGRLRDLDFISSVSGGGFIASFLGRLYSRLSNEGRVPAAERVERTLKDLASPEIQWLRYNAQYLAGGGRHDLLFDIAIILRNLAAVHVWIGVLLFGLLGALRWFALDCPKLRFLSSVCDVAPPSWQGITLSPWWWLPLALFVLGVLPPSIGYWLTMKRRPKADWRAWLPFFMWVVMLGCAIAGLSVPGIGTWSAAALGIILLAWFEQQAFWLHMQAPASRGADAQPVAPGAARPEDGSTVVRNRLTRLLAAALWGFAVTLLFVVLDTLAQYVTDHNLRATLRSMGAAAPILAALRGIAASVMKCPSEDKPGSDCKSFATTLVMQVLLSLLAFALAFVLLLFVDVLVYLAFSFDVAAAHYSVIVALVISLAKGLMLPFLNLSSLQQSYAQKIVRTYLGASNDARVNPVGTNAPVPVGVSDLGDDVEFDDYHPENNGGPLHLINTTLNNTVDPASGNQLRGDKGMPMCVGPAGISTGRRFHALWKHRDAATPARVSPVSAVRVRPDPNEFHALARSDDVPVLVERLRLGQWIAISGAAASTGLGRDTKLARSLLLGLLNFRIGYWWNTSIPFDKRPGRYPPALWRRIKSLPSKIFTLQARLLDEWRAYFQGPSARLWYLSDGGHFDNTGIYEFIRRRLPFIIALDASGDPQYRCDPLALLVRQVRYDFCAKITWVDPAVVCANHPPPAPDAPPPPHHEALLPDWIRKWLDPKALCVFTDLKRDSAQGAALARITYSDDATRVSWMLFIKPCVGGDLPNDTRAYEQNYEDFPQQTTADQFFDDDQWEAYRELGYCAGLNVFRARPESPT